MRHFYPFPVSYVDRPHLQLVIGVYEGLPRILAVFRFHNPLLSSLERGVKFLVLVRRKRESLSLILLVLVVFVLVVVVVIVVVIVVDCV